MSVRISSTATAVNTPAMSASTARKLREPITGNGPLVARYNTHKHGLWVGDILVAIEDAWDGFRNAETDEQATKEHARYTELRDIARRM